MASKRVLADEIYDALLDDAAFAALPARLAETLGGRSTLIHWHHGDGEASVLAHSGYFTDAQLLIYATEFAADDPWAKAAARGQQPNAALDLETLIPLDRFTRTRFFNDYVRPMGDDTARCLGVMLRSRFGQGMIAVQRGRSQGGFTAAQVAEMDAAAVHLRRLLAVRGQLAGLDRRLGAARQMLDALPQAALLVRSDGRIVAMNVRAEALLREGQMLHAPGGRLAMRRGGAELMTAIARACHPSAPTAGAVHLGGGGGLVTVSPIRDDQGARSAMLLIAEPPAGDGIARLQAMYRLTDAEAAVAAHLAAGDSIARIVELRRVTAATVRTQIRAISDKMGCRRQAEIAVATARVIGLG